MTCETCNTVGTQQCQNCIVHNSAESFPRTIEDFVDACLAIGKAWRIDDAKTRS